MRLPLTIVLVAMTDVCGHKGVVRTDTDDTGSDTAQCSAGLPTVSGSLSGAPGATLNIFGTNLGGAGATVRFTTSSGHETVTPTMGDDESIAVVIPLDAVSGEITIANGMGCAIKVPFTVE